MPRYYISSGFRSTVGSRDGYATEREASSVADAYKKAFPEGSFRVIEEE